MGKLREYFPNVPILGLTATATDKIKDDVIKNLGMKNRAYFQNSYNRKNLY